MSKPSALAVAWRLAPSIKTAILSDWGIKFCLTGDVKKLAMGLQCQRRECVGRKTATEFGRRAGFKGQAPADLVIMRQIVDVPRRHGRHATIRIATSKTQDRI